MFAFGKFIYRDTQYFFSSKNYKNINILNFKFLLDLFIMTKTVSQWFEQKHPHNGKIQRGLFRISIIVCVCNRQRTQPNPNFASKLALIPEWLFKPNEKLQIKFVLTLDKLVIIMIPPLFHEYQFVLFRVVRKIANRTN